VQHRAGIGMAEVERDAPLAAIERLEEERVLVLLKRRHVAPDVPVRRGVLELHDVRTEVGQLQGAPRPGPELLHGKDPDVREGETHAPAASGSRAAFHAFS
jgi:hypothetical protein